MQILVVGGSGILGSEIVNFLCKNYKVYSTYRSSKPKKIKGVVWKKINLEYSINWKIKPDIIINCVVTSKFSKKKQTENYINSNIIAVKNILDFAIKKKTKKIINLSTISVYKLGEKKTINENSEIDTRNILSITKYIGEQILINNKVDYINLRLPAVLNLNLEKNHSWLNTLSIDLRNNKKIKIFNPISKFNSVIHIKQIFELLDKIINQKKKMNGTFNFLPQKPEKLVNIIMYIKKIYKSKSNIKFIKTSFISPFFSSKKILSVLKLQIPSTLSIVKNSFTN